MQTVGRFAPSPTGRMHAGNIFAALVSWLLVKSEGGKIILRIEDLDAERSKPEFISRIPADFERLGLTWDEGPYYQHDRTDVYRQYYQLLQERALVFPCFCTRADLLAASAPHRGEKSVYPGTCKHLSEIERQKAAERRSPAFRVEVPNDEITIDDLIQGPYVQNLERDCGDFIVRRSDGGFAYQLAVVVDDGLSGVNLVVRGVDLLCSTPQQVFLQQCLGFQEPQYAHVPLLTSQAGVRLSKRNKDASIDAMIEELGSPEAVIGHIAWLTGLLDVHEPASPTELLQVFSLNACRSRWQGCIEIPWQSPQVAIEAR